jgi:methylglutaconyl-CoA hydratase
MTAPETATETIPGNARANGHVDVEVTRHVATIRFGHPKGNSLPGSVLRQLADAVTALGGDPEARVIVLRSDGAGPFCAGASFSELSSIADAERGREFFMGFARLILAMRSCPKFILARVHGRAVGGGVGVVAAADYAVALRTASVKLSELAVGIGPFVVGPVIEKKIGLGGLQALAVDAAGFRDADWAERRGLYSAVYDTVEELDRSLETLAATLSLSNPEAMAKMKQVFWKGTEHWDDLLAERAEMSGTLVLSDFTRNAIAAFATR